MQYTPRVVLLRWPPHTLWPNAASNIVSQHYAIRWRQVLPAQVLRETDLISYGNSPFDLRTSPDWRSHRIALA